MRAPSLLVLSCLLLAGCSGGSGGDEPTEEVITDPGQLETGKGAIQGLLIDDRFRPLANGLVLLQPAGLTATSDDNGEFQFVNVDPGRYTARATLEGHEAAPQQVQVTAGAFAELNVEARRIFNEQGQVVTQEYSVFIPCAADFVVQGIVVSCLADLSGDSYRPGFTVNYTATKNVTYLVTEMKASQVASYSVQVRHDDGSSSGGERYAVGSIKDGDYIKMVNQWGVQNVEHNLQNNSVPWNNTKPFMTIVFLEGDYQSEIDQGLEPACQPTVDDLTPAVPVVGGDTCRQWRGLGGRFGITAKFVQSLFLGEPTVSIADYHVME